MARADMDDGVRKLEEFCGVLLQTTAQLQADKGTLDNLGDAIERFEGTVEETLGTFNQHLSDALRSLEEAEESATEDVRRLGDGARTLAESRLSPAEEDIGQSEEALEDRVADTRADLEEGASRLTDAGFQPLGAAVDELEAEAGRLDEDADRAFDELKAGAEGERQRVEESQEEVGQEVAEATDGLLGNERDGLDTDTATCVEGWSVELPQTLGSQAAGIGDPVQQAYDQVEDRSQEERTAIVESVSDAMKEAADFTITGAAAELETEGHKATDESMEILAGELGGAAAVLEAGDEVTRSLPPMVAELEVVKAVVEEIDRMLNVMEQ